MGIRKKIANGLHKTAALVEGNNRERGMRSKIKSLTRDLKDLYRVQARAQYLSVHPDVMRDAAVALADPIRNRRLQISSELEENGGRLSRHLLRKLDLISKESEHGEDPCPAPIEA